MARQEILLVEPRQKTVTLELLIQLAHKWLIARRVTDKDLKTPHLVGHSPVIIRDHMCRLGSTQHQHHKLCEFHKGGCMGADGRDVYFKELDWLRRSRHFHMNRKI